MDRAEAIKVLQSNLHLDCSFNMAIKELEAREVAIAALREQDVAPVVHGFWRGEGDGYADGEIVLDVWYCSKCDHCIDNGTDDPELLPNYCPNCGAKMDGGKHETD